MEKCLLNDLHMCYVSVNVVSPSLIAVGAGSEVPGTRYVNMFPKFCGITLIIFYGRLVVCLFSFAN